MLATEPPLGYNEPVDNTIYSNLNGNNLTCHLYCDKEFLLHENLENGEIGKTVIKSPEIQITINNLKINAFIDTGSNISCVSEEWFLTNKTLLGKFEELPVTNLFIKTAVNSKSRRITRVILLEASLKGHSFNIQCLIIPHLVRPLILGTDILQNLKANINYENQTIGFTIDGNKISTTFNEVNGDAHVCHITQYVPQDFHPPVNKNKTVPQNESLQEEITRNKLQKIFSDNNLMDDQQKNQLINLILKYKDVFSDKPGLCNKYQHKLIVKNETSFKCQSYPIPIAYQEQVAAEINKMVEMGIIERSTSPFINPIIPVVKKSGEIRLCLDARRLNEILIPDYEQNRSVNELLSKAKTCRWLSSVDLTSSYWQVELTPESRRYTAFQFRGKTYQYVVTPFGISTSQAALVRALDNVFEEDLENFTMIYIDDISVLSNSFDEHLDHLKKIFTKLRNANMTIKFSKSVFCRQQVPFLGYILTTTGLEMDKSRIQVIQDYPSPKSRKQLKAFLGCINYYNKFLDKYSDTVQPLMRLTSKKTKFIWSAEDEETFRKVKQLFLQANVLHHPDPNKEYWLQTDASNHSIGGHLYQIKPNGEKAAIMFISRTLHPTEQRYTTTEKELLAIVHCLQKTRYITLGSKINIVTDNNALTFIKTCRLLNARLTRWILAIQDYNYTISHCKGKENPTADALSRIESDQSTSNFNVDQQEILIAYLSEVVDEALLEKLQNLSIYQQQDPILAPIYESLSVNANVPKQELIQNKYKLYNHILFQRHKESWKIIIPEAIINQLIWNCHLVYMHCGAQKVHQLLTNTFTFKNMARRIRKTLRSCDICQRCKSNPHPLYGHTTGIKCIQKNDQLAVDLIGPLPTGKGNVNYILIVIDIFTKFVKLYPLRKATTKTIINKIFNQHIPEYGSPKKIQTDNGSQFKSNQWIKTLEENQIIPVFSPLYFPKANLAERPIKEVKRCLRTYCSTKHRTWPDFIPKINQVLNELQHDTTKYTPNELQHGTRDIRFWEDIIHNPFQQEESFQAKVNNTYLRIRQKQRKRSQKLNDKHQSTHLQIGDYVLIKNHSLSNKLAGETAKLFEIYQGPYQIDTILGHSTYNVKDSKTGKVFGPYHISAIKKYIFPNHQEIM